MAPDKPSSKDKAFLNDENTPVNELTAFERWMLPAMDDDLPKSVGSHAFKSRDLAKQAQEAEDEIDEEELRPPTAEEIEAIRQAAYDEGYGEGKAEGQEAGYKAGYDAGLSDVKAVAARLSQVCRALLEPIPAQDEELEEALLTLVRSICERVVQRELLLDSRHIVTIVREAIDCLKPGHKRVRIHVNPDDAEHLTRELTALGELDEQWRILPHPTISPGGCIVDTDTSMIDVRAERRLATVIRQVYKKLDDGLAKDDTSNDLQQVMSEVPTFSASDEQDDEEFEDDNDA